MSVKFILKNATSDFRSPGKIRKMQEKRWSRIHLVYTYFHVYNKGKAL